MNWKEQGKHIARYGVDRFKEPSSWSGIAAVLAAVGLHLDANTVQSIIYIGAGLCGLVAWYIPE